MMNGFELFKLCFAGLTLIHLSCNDCHRIRCEQHIDIVQIRLLHDGKNAVFGPDAFIARDSISLYTPLGPDYPDQYYTIDYIDSTQSLSLSLKPGRLQILAFPGNVDTLVGNYTIYHSNDCCPPYELTAILRNGEQICSNDCEEVIEIGI